MKTKKYDFKEINNETTFPESATFSHQDIIDIRDNEPIGREILFRSPRMSHGGKCVTLDIYNHNFSTKFDLLVTQSLLEQSYSYVLNALNKGINLNINVNHSSLEDHTVLSNIYQLNDVLQCYGIQLVVELVEYTEPSKKSIYQVKKLQGNGVKIAIDDFGSGYNTYSNLTWIKKPDYIKLVYNSSVLNFSKDIDSAFQYFEIGPENLVVEHIDSEHKSNNAAVFGVHYQQGFFFKKDMSYLI